MRPNAARGRGPWQGAPTKAYQRRDTPRSRNTARGQEGRREVRRNSKTSTLESVGSRESFDVVEPGCLRIPGEFEANARIGNAGSIREVGDVAGLVLHPAAAQEQEVRERVFGPEVVDRILELIGEAL